MKLGFCSWLLSGVSLPEQVEFLAEAGFNSLSLLQSAIDFAPTESAEAAAAIKEHHFTMTYHGNVHANLTEDKRIDPDFAQKVFDNVRWWQEHTNAVVSCCSDMISFFPDNSGKRTWSPEETTRLCQMEADYFEPLGIGYGIENCLFMPLGGGYAAIEEMHKLKRQLVNAPNAGMIFDVGHANVFLTRDNNKKMSLMEYIKEIPFKIYEIHITDNHGLEDEHLLPGRGNINYSELHRSLAAINFNGVISLEICPDILHNQYHWDISKPEIRDLIINAKNDFLALFNQ